MGPGACRSGRAESDPSPDTRPSVVSPPATLLAAPARHARLRGRRVVGSARPILGTRIGMKLHLEVLPPEQLRVLRPLGPIADREGFYLAGGTALALQLGHRRSIDFDWF